MNMMPIRIPAVSVVTLLCLSCAQMMTVDVNGIRKSDSPLPSHVTYAVLPTNEVAQDPEFPRYADMVAKKLEERDYRRTEAKVANLGVYVAYGVIDRSAKPTSEAPSPQVSVGSGGSMAPGGGTYGMVGSSPSDATAYRYATQVVIVVVDLAKSRAGGSLMELWRGEARTSGSSNVPARTIPVLVDAAFRHLGETTPRQMQYTFREDDEKVKQLRELK